MLAGIAGGAIAGLICGIVILRAHGLPQLVLSIALIHLFHELANKTPRPGQAAATACRASRRDPILGMFAFDLWGRTAYVFAVVLLIVGLHPAADPGALAVRHAVPRHQGGSGPRSAQWAPRPSATLIKMYVISGAVAGVGGALNAITTQVVGLDSLSFTLSAEALVMLVLGGTGSLYGALAGTVIFMLFEDFVSAANPFHWLTMVGALLIAVVLFAPKGLYGTAAGPSPALEGKSRRDAGLRSQGAEKVVRRAAVTRRRFAVACRRATASR